MATSVVALLTCFNRKPQTLSCLEGLFGQRVGLVDVQLTAVLVDDGCDGTGAEVASRWGKNVRVIAGTGDLYWAGGMATAQRAVLAKNTPDYLLWLNDDVLLEDGALLRLLTAAARDPNAVIVGPVCDPVSGRLNYGGQTRVGPSPTQLRLAALGTSEVDTMHGNVVLVSRDAYSRLGSIDDRAYRHAYGDIDYGLRAREVGHNIVALPQPIGTCPSNPVNGTWQDRELPPMRRIKLLLDIKVRPIRDHAAFVRRHSNRAWLWYFVRSYLHAIYIIVSRRSAA